jgi:drug/metabolite transporter (DMT)-like permease
MFYALFFVFYNVALSLTTVARGTLALSTLPLMTMLVGALLGIEALSARKTTGVLIAMTGVGVALASGLRTAPAGAWRGDLIMAGATLCMAFYSVWSRPFIKRSSALGFVSAGMGVGGVALAVFSLLSGDAARIAEFTPQQGIAALYLAAGGGALAFFLWVYALQYASPTRVTNTMTVNPLIAGLSAALILDEPVTLNLIAGLIAVFAGLWIATSEGNPKPAQIIRD